ncbi:uncharacterized protein MELLADRAFT_74881 [Melampsora larici-populina 98AG31]|uniref:Zinc-ribbon 15 domain-containing protein n=1 Tax=Melampsora larici-populina (strain 98AG31 / pathotype 3-4-7) TaxID=747676 RepID=F4RN36_MELLP|nr:uncharacterized protein MELLADRAFT_74881 [Melampsora larici-populina 98AG31]EGG06286.1 hypothetical protein MELLADRAFT_74881 [Melampsora larici-populina 98AG31]
MCDDICICISIGCPTKINQGGGDGQPRICPRCHNASVFQADSRMWIEICCVPLIPLKSKDIWHCSICNWQAELNSFQPMIAGFAPPVFAQPGYAPNMQPGPPPSQPM